MNRIFVDKNKIFSDVFHFGQIRDQKRQMGYIACAVETISEKRDKNWIFVIVKLKKRKKEKTYLDKILDTHP